MKPNMPVYPDDEVSVFIEKIAARKGIYRSSAADELLRGDMKISETCN